MASCEYCWGEAYRRGIEYREMLLIAERDELPCCETIEGFLTERAARHRAGQFWNEVHKCDGRRIAPSTAAPTSGQTRTGDDFATIGDTKSE